MVKLPQELEKYGYHMVLLKRNDTMAMFECTSKDSGNVIYEVVKIQIQQPVEFPDGASYPLKEVVPPTSKWGQLGWTYFNKDSAEYVYNLLSKTFNPELLLQSRHRKIIEPMEQKAYYSLRFIKV